MIKETGRGFELDLQAIPYVNEGGWARVGSRGTPIGAWTLRTLSRDLLGVNIKVWEESNRDSYRSYSFRVSFRERGGGEEWSVWSRYDVNIPKGSSCYRFNGVRVNSIDDARVAVGADLRELLLNIKADVDHLLAFYGAVGT
jgi:hypothetical protein